MARPYSANHPIFAGRGICTAKDALRSLGEGGLLAFSILRPLGFGWHGHIPQTTQSSPAEVSARRRRAARFLHPSPVGLRMARPYLQTTKSSPADPVAWRRMPCVALAKQGRAFFTQNALKSMIAQAISSGEGCCSTHSEAGPCFGKPAHVLRLPYRKHDSVNPALCWVHRRRTSALG